jgi:TRAP-type C4-dicarboxylate transport system permease small subunit
MTPTPDNSPLRASDAPTSEPVFRRIDKALMLFALIGGGFALAFLTLLSVVNVLVMRKALNAPIKGAEDILVLALVVLVALAIPFGARTGAHIEIEVLEAAMSKSFARVSLLVMKILSFIVLAVMGWRLLVAGVNAARFGESSQTLLISFAPFYYLLSASIGVYCIVLLLEMWQLARKDGVPRLSIPGDAE